MNLSEKILEIRLWKDLSQERFAELLGYSQKYISNIETGKTKPSRRMLEAIASKLGISLDWLFLDSKILDLIEINKYYDNKDLICLYGFTQKDLDRGEQILKDLLKERRYAFIDATNKTGTQIIKEIVGGSEGGWELWEVLKKTLLREEIIVVLKNISRSKISNKAEGGLVRSIFKTIDDAHIIEKITPKSALVLLDFASFIEKLYEGMSVYITPIYVGEPKGLTKTTSHLGMPEE